MDKVFYQMVVTTNEELAKPQITREQYDPGGPE